MAPAFMQPTAVSSLTEPVTIRKGTDGARSRASGERGHAVEAGQGVVGEDEVGLELLDLAQERFAGIHPPGGEGDAGPLELVLHELGVHRHVFQNEDAKGAGPMRDSACRMRPRRLAGIGLRSVARRRVAPIYLKSRSFGESARGRL